MGRRFIARLSGWLRIPDDSTLGRILKTVGERHIAEMETLVHQVRTKVWKKALRSGTSTEVKSVSRWMLIQQ
jgi:hypothetical protein